MMHKMMIKWLVLCVVLTALPAAEPAKILSVLPVTVRSHSILYDRLLKELATKGHEITYITPYLSKTPTKNIKEVIIPDFKEKIIGKDDMNPELMTAFGTLVSVFTLLAMPLLSTSVNQMILETPEVQQLINEEKFDLIFGEPYMDEALIAGMAYKNQAPIVALSTLMPNMWSNFAVGNPGTSSYIANPFLPYHTHMGFVERTINLMVNLIGDISLPVSHCLMDRTMRQHFGDDMPYLGNIIRNTSLLLVNNHPALNFARPQTPNTIDVGGMHIYPPKPLPEDLETFMRNSKNGVVLFSMGTNVKSKDLGEKKIQDILKAFGRLKENVIWKFETDLENLPSNVKIAKWLPQSDILAHPNLKMFITHGGLLSTTEAAFRGVPVVGIPIIADQPINMKHTENAGFGITLNFGDITEETLFKAITEVLTNPKYKNEATKRSRLLQDTMAPPLETAVWWIEHILRTNGAPHLRSAAQDLCWFQLYQFDTILMTILITVSVIGAQVWIVKKIVKCLCNRKAKAKTAAATAKKQKKNN